MTRTPERYTKATSSSHLRVEPFPCDIDPIIAAGWVTADVSTELYRLMAELDGADKRLFHVSVIDARLDWAMLSARLQSMAGARRQMVSFAHRLRRERFRDVQIELVQPIALALLHLMLFPTCPECTGRKFQVIPNTPNLSHKVCRACNGTGDRPLTVPGGRLGYDFAAALEAGVRGKLQVLFELMKRHLRNQLDLPIGTKRGNERITEHCEQVLRDNPNDGAAQHVLQRVNESAV